MSELRTGLVAWRSLWMLFQERGTESAEGVKQGCRHRRQSAGAELNTSPPAALGMDLIAERFKSEGPQPSSEAAFPPFLTELSPYTLASLYHKRCPARLLALRISWHLPLSPKVVG